MNRGHDGDVKLDGVKYWIANDLGGDFGLVLMPNEVEACRVAPKAFEFKGTNGFMITSAPGRPGYVTESRLGKERECPTARSSFS